jgi:hypothetical protein
LAGVAPRTIRSFQEVLRTVPEISSRGGDLLVLT